MSSKSSYTRPLHVVSIFFFWLIFSACVFFVENKSKWNGLVNRNKTDMGIY